MNTDVHRSLKIKCLGDSAAIGRNLRTGINHKKHPGFTVFSVPENAHPITLDDVKKLEDEI